MNRAEDTERKKRGRAEWKISLVILAALAGASALQGGQNTRGKQASSTSHTSHLQKTTRDFDRRLAQLSPQSQSTSANSASGDYRIGPGDLLQISVFEAPDLSRTVRISARGKASLPLIGSVPAAGLTTRGLESTLEKLLRGTYMKDPHVSVFVKEIESHPVSVFGAVRKPGVYQIRGSTTLIAMLSRAQGLAADAGDAVIVIHHGDRPTAKTAAGSAAPAVDGQEGPGSSYSRDLRISLKDLLVSGDPRLNVMIEPGDVITVTRAGIVYVVGEVKKPGGFLLRGDASISVLQAIALAEGLTRTSAAEHARIIRTDSASGRREEIPINLKKILSGKAPDPPLRSKDIVFVPNSAGKSAFYRGAEAALSIAGGVIVYRR